MATSVNFDKIVAKTVGVKRAGYALVTKNTHDDLTHGEVKFLSRVRKVSITPSYAENELDSNDAVEAQGNEIQGYTVSFDATGIDAETEAEIYGHKLDENGGMIERDGDEPPELALILELAMSGNHSKYVILYCGSVKHPTEEAESKTRSGFTYSNPTLEFSFGKSLNGLLKYSLRTDSPNYKPEVGEAWFDAVTYPGTVSALSTAKGAAIKPTKA